MQDNWELVFSMNQTATLLLGIFSYTSTFASKLHLENWWKILSLLLKAPMDLMVCQKSCQRWWASSTLVALCFTSFHSFLWSSTQATRISVQRNEWIPFHDNPSDNLSLIRKLDEFRSIFFILFGILPVNCTFWLNVIDAFVFLCCFIQLWYRYELCQFSFEMNCDSKSFHLFAGDKCAFFSTARSK